MVEYSFVGSLIGVVVGAVISGAVTFLANRQNNSNVMKREKAQARKDQYYMTLDATHRLRSQFEYLRQSLSGRKSEVSAKSDEECQESRQKDEQGVNAIESIHHELEEMQRLGDRLEMVGSSAVVISYKKLLSVIADYRGVLHREVNTNGIFRASSYSAFISRYDQSVEELKQTMRKDFS